MKIQTAHFGERDVEESDIIYFPEGFPGFENKKRFALMPEDLEPPVFFFLQSVDDPTLAFTVSFAQKFGIAYDDSLLTSDDLSILELDGFSDAVILLLISENRDHPHRRRFDPKFIPHISNPMVVNPGKRKGVYKELPGVRCSATVTPVNEPGGDAEKSREDYLRFLAMMQAGVKAP